MNTKGNILITILLVVLILTTVLLCFFISRNPKPIDNNPAHEPSPQATETSYLLKSSTCNQDECLFTNTRYGDVVEGYAKLQGYYQKKEKTAYGEQVTCDGFIVTDGSENLITSIKSWISQGNSINEIDKNNNLIVGIHPKDLPLDLQNKISSSNSKNQVELGVIRRTPIEMGAGACGSYIDIVSVQ